MRVTLGVGYLHRIVHARRVDEIHERAHDERMRDHKHVAASRRTDRIAGLGKKTHQTGLDRVESLSAARGIRVRDDVGHLGQPTVVLLERQRACQNRRRARHARVLPARPPTLHSTIRANADRARPQTSLWPPRPKPGREFQAAPTPSAQPDHCRLRTRGRTPHRPSPGQAPPRPPRPPA